MSKINPVFFREESVTDTFVRLVMAQVGFILSTFTKSGRRSTAVDIIFERFLGKLASRVNKERAAVAIATGKAKYNRMDSYEVLRGIYLGDEEIKFSEVDAVDLSLKIAKAIGYSSYIGPTEATAVLNALAKAYAEDENNGYMKLEDLSATALESVDQVADPTNPAANSNLMEQVLENSASSAAV